MLLLLASQAWANGQVGHHFATRHALEHLPPGDLLDLVSDPDMERYLINGASFPDSGYAVNHAYGEHAHWEPLQDTYRDWLLSEFDDLTHPDAAPYVAFYLGLASHGMADQVYDALFMARSKFYEPDAWAASDDFDQATDVVFASLAGGVESPEPWFPDAMPQVMAARGLTVDADTILEGQELVLLAQDLVLALGENDAAVESQAALFPWAAENLYGHGIPGDPECEGETVALYWQALWDDLHTGWGPLEVLRTLPTDGAYEHEPDSALIDSWVTVVFSKGLPRDGVRPQDFSVVGPDGEPLDVQVDLFYGDDSHVVHLLPERPWPEQGWITVTVLPGLTAQDGRQLEEPVSMRFTADPTPLNEDPAPGCGGCGSAGAVGPWALGLLLLFRRRRSWT